MAKKITLETAARKFADAMASAHNQTSIVTQCVNACAAAFGGETPTTKQVNAFANEVAAVRGWSESSAKARKSEVRNIVREYVQLPETIKRVVDDERSDGFTWHNAIKLARLLKTHQTPAAAHAAYFETSKSKPATASVKITNAAKSLANVVANTKKQKDFIAAFVTLCDKHGVSYE